VGFIGYPNVGKSSVINTLRSKKVCPAAPIPGYTKVWQYITLFRKIFLIDCPGVVYPGDENSETDCVLKGVVRIENLEEPAAFVPAVLERVKKEYLVKTYKIDGWTDSTDFLTILGKRMGRLKKGGDPDYNATAKTVLYDWQRGKLPFFLPPPFDVEPQPSNSSTLISTKVGPLATGNTEEQEQSNTKQNTEQKHIDAPDQILQNLTVREEFQSMPDNKEEIITENQTENPIIDWDEVYKSVDPDNDDNDQMGPIDLPTGDGLPYIKPKKRKAPKQQKRRKGKKQKSQASVFDEFEIVRADKKNKQ